MVAKLRALVLDFDGVLVESEGLKTEVFREVFAEYPEHTAALMAFHEANPTAPRHLKFAHLAERLGRANDANLLQSLGVEFSRRAIERTATCREVPGASEFLHEFAQRLPLYLASITPETDLREILRRRNWLQHFTNIFGYPPRSKTEAVTLALQTVGDLQAAVALIGDAPSDYAVAHETGIEFIGRNSGLIFPPPAPPLFADMRAIADFVRTRL